MTLVDFPGYGHAIASDNVKKNWKKMIEKYLKERIILSRYVTC